jgi:hypothetical protein
MFHNKQVMSKNSFEKQEKLDLNLSTCQIK